MPDIDAALKSIADARAHDPLAPVTVITPSHPAALQLRRRLAEFGPFAGVRFETLPRVAELLGAGSLAAAGRSPLARPIGDYVAEQVARRSTGALSTVGDLPGYARVLRQIFRRLRRGGVHHASDLPGRTDARRLDEILRLYEQFRAETAQFYDDEDLLEAAAGAVRADRAGALADIGEVYVVPPGAQTAGAAEFLAALKESAPAYTELAESETSAETRFILAPDPASEAREVVRDVISALESGVAIHEIAVFHGADSAYPRLLREAFEAAQLPVVPLPGVPLAETPAGRGVLALAMLPERDHSRTAMMDLLTIAPLKPWLPGRNGDVRAQPTVFDRVSRKAGVTCGADAWPARLEALILDCQQQIDERDNQQEDTRVRAAQYEREQANALLDVIGPLIAKLETLRHPQAADGFIRDFKEIIRAYFDPGAPALERVLAEVDQLGTVGAIGGTFSLLSFAQALDANLNVAYAERTRKLGDGVILADYRQAAGLRFKHVVLCGAYEGALPAGPGADALIDNRVWEGLRESHPFIEDATTRIDRAEAAARRAVATAGDGTLVWSAPLHEAGGTRSYYPSRLMVEAAREKAGDIATATDLRAYPANNGWLRRSSSPLAVTLTGPLVDGSEIAVREAILGRANGGDIDPSHPRWNVIAMLRARRSDRFTEWDGNLTSLEDVSWLDLQKAVSPTSLENYALCGFRYLCNSLLRLNVVEEPEDLEVISPADRGTLIHRVLERFFKRQKERGRPVSGEAWTEADLSELVRLLEEELQSAKRRGKTGLEVYAGHDSRTIRADMARFLEADTEFRTGTGAVPTEFETYIPETEVAGVKLRGRVDRIDRTADGRRAWVIDYKSGGTSQFKDIQNDPLVGGTKLQLPAYLEAARDAEEARAMYWFITRKGGFAFVEYDSSPENREIFARTLAAIVGGIRKGVFPAVPGEENDYYGKFTNCRFCDFDRICSRRRDYELAAKEQDAALAPWQAVAIAASPGGDP